MNEQVAEVCGVIPSHTIFTSDTPLVLQAKAEMTIFLFISHKIIDVGMVK